VARRWRMLVKEYAGKIDLIRAKAFLGDDYDVYTNKQWMSGLLKSRPAEPWVEFQAGEKAPERP
jgi:hypothetical protein